MGHQFATTQWSVIVEARQGSESQRRRALSSLFESYWFPIYAFVRRKGYAPAEAEDLTQSFFTYLIEKEVLETAEPGVGRFRSFLMATCTHFLAHEREKAQALKRGGQAVTLPLSTSGSPEERYGWNPVDNLTPESVFERQWALTVIERSLSRLREESRVNGKVAQFERLRGCLTGVEPHTPYRGIASELGVSESAVRGFVYRLRQRLGSILREEIAETVVDPGDVDDELRHLLAVIAPLEAQHS